MRLPVMPPVQPMLAKSVKDIPDPAKFDGGLSFEPKWDGFRCIVFRDGDEVELTSRNTKPLTRYFPEVVEAVRTQLPERCVLDGELFVAVGARLEFEVLQERIHPAASRIKLLAEQTPADFVAFDLLALDDDALLDSPFADRRATLESVLAGRLDVTPMTRVLEEAEPWLGSGEGVVAKDVRAPYRPGERIGMVKVKRVRTIDAVVAGWRPGKEDGTVGSLILGLYDDEDKLHIVGHSSGLRAAEKRALVAKLAPYETGKRGHGDPSRWKNEKELEWIDLRPELVVEVTYDHTSGGRIRHGTKILRWREDKAPLDCKLEQMR
jgi:ATP-dependent DNA ligase